MYRSGSSAGEQYTNGCFQEFSCEHRIWEGGETTRRAWARNTEHRKTKIESGKAHQNYRFQTDGSGYALVHGRHTDVEPRTKDFWDYMLVTTFMSDKYLIGIRGQVQYIRIRIQHPALIRIRIRNPASMLWIRNRDPVPFWPLGTISGIGCFQIRLYCNQCFNRIKVMRIRIRLEFLSSFLPSTLRWNSWS